MKSKYVVFDGIHAVCFNGSLVHAGFAYADRHTNPNDFTRMFPTSAGFYELSVVRGPFGEKIHVEVSGRSESLGLDSKRTDADLIALSLGIVQ